MPGPLIIFIICIFIAILVLTILQSSKRTREWQEFANAHHLAFSHSDINDLPEKYSNFDLFKDGNSKIADNLCYGNDKGLEIITCDYQYTVGSEKRSQTDFFNVLIVKTPLMFQPVLLRRENVVDKLGSAVGFEDINFESAEFSKTFYVKSSDKKFAFDIFHPRMMELFLSNQDIFFEARGSAFVMFQRGTQAISKMESLLTFAHQFMELIPGYLKKDMEMKVKGN